MPKIQSLFLEFWPRKPDEAEPKFLSKAEQEAETLKPQ